VTEGGTVQRRHALRRPLTVTADGQTTTFAYDPYNRWVAAANGESVDTIKLDARRRVTDAITWRNGVRYLLQPSYTAEGLRDLLKIVAPTWSRDIGYGYDSLFRLNYLRHQGGQAASITYTPEHLPSTVKLPVTVSGTTKLTETFTYTPAHRPQALAYNGGAVDVALGRRYTYDALGRVASVTRGQPPSPDALQDEMQRSFRYDALGRLSHYEDVHYWQEDGGIVCPDPFDLTTCYRDVIPHADLVRQQDFTYDAVGNRTDLGAVLEPGNRLTSFNGTTLGYDADGNLMSKTKPGFTQTLTWTTRGELVSVTTNGVTTTFGYDGFGRRVRKTTGATTTRYLWDGDELVVVAGGVLWRAVNAAR
jgi:YD repeat-containing protein